MDLTSTCIALAIVAGAYLLGALPFGYLIAKARGVDIFTEGSGNIGATNVGRVLGQRFGIVVFLLDFGKGALPTLAAQSAWRHLGAGDQSSVLAGLPVWAGLAAFLGHCYPVYLKFHGGKGVATGAGVVCVLMPVPAIAALAAWLVLLAALRYVSLASMGAAVVLVAVYFMTIREPFGPEHGWRSAFCIIAAVMVFVRHRTNISRLIAGTEGRQEEKPMMTALARVLHVLAVGLWFGSAIFFTFVVGLTLFRTFEGLASKPDGEREVWFPVAEIYKPEDVRKEQGTRAAGAAVSPMFPIFMMIQTACGFVALVTAAGWLRSHPCRIQSLRVVVLAAAVVLVLASWPVQGKVSDLRVQRNQSSEDYLRALSVQSEKVGELQAAADRARGDFGSWHVVSLFMNFGTVALVGLTLGLAAFLPTPRSPLAS